MTSSSKRVVKAVASTGGVPQLLEADDVSAWQHRWRAVFAVALRDATGRAVHHDFDWHVFSYGYQRALEGWKAEQAYAAVGDCDYVVVSAWAHDVFGVRCKGKPPTFKAVDVLVMPETIEWTMAFTHEAAHGPYFAEPTAANDTASDQLPAANRRRSRKQR